MSVPPQRHDGRGAVEQNPSLGWRAIRVSLQKKAPFKAQLRALLRAAAAYLTDEYSKARRMHGLRRRLA